MMDTFSIYFGLKLSFFLFTITEQLSITFQGKSITVDDCFMAVTLCIRSLKRHQTDSLFHSFFEGVKEEALSRCDSPVLPRQRQIPRRLDSGSSQHVFTSVEEYFRKVTMRPLTASQESLRDVSVKITSFLCRKLKVCYLIVPMARMFLSHH